MYKNSRKIFFTKFFFIKISFNNECLYNYNDCFENNIEFEIDNFLINYKDKHYKKIKDKLIEEIQLRKLYMI